MKAKPNMKTKSGTRIAFFKSTTAYIALLVLLGNDIINSRAYGQDCDATGTIQAIQGSETVIKFGFICPSDSGCETHYYLAHNATSSSKSTVDIQNKTPCCYAQTHSEQSTMTAGANFEYYEPVGDSSACPPTYTKKSAPAGTVVNINKNTVQSCGTGSPCPGGFSDDCNTEYLNNVLQSGIPPCDLVPMPLGSTDVKNETVVKPCGGTFSKTTYTYNNGDVHAVKIETIDSSSEYQNEYTTGEVVSKANMCAGKKLQSLSFPGGGPSSAVCSFRLTDNNSSASVTMARWRVAITGAIANHSYAITLYGTEVVGTTVNPIQINGTAVAPSDGVWYFPNEGGSALNPKENSQSCEYSGYSYTKQLLSVSVKAAK